MGLWGLYHPWWCCSPGTAVGPGTAVNDSEGSTVPGVLPHTTKLLSLGLAASANRSSGCSGISVEPLLD